MIETTCQCTRVVKQSDYLSGDAWTITLVIMTGLGTTTDPLTFSTTDGGLAALFTAGVTYPFIIGNPVP